MQKTPVKPRIVIYGVGQYGAMIARLALAKDWPIVAAFNRAGPKVGQDLGRAIGLSRDIGVIVQDSQTGDYAAIDADIGVVTHRDLLSANMHAYRNLMNAGLNIACHGVQSYLPQSNDATCAAEIEVLAQSNGVTFTGGGIWDMSRIWSGILTTGPCTELRSIHISSLTDPQGQANSLQQIKQYCISDPVDMFYAKRIDKNPAALAKKTIPEMVLRALGYTIIESTARIEPVVYDVPIATHFVPEGYFAAGLCMGVRFHCETTTEEGVTGTGMIEQRMFLPGDVEHMYWEVDGTPRTRTRVERLDSAHATAGNLFNRLPDIIAARPGIVPVYEMGPLKSTANSAAWPRP
jgi:4-hydroxy-tetrahydrodipicolinate reductase